MRPDDLVKTCYLYSVASRLINVRLDADRLRKARRLREHGLVLSEVVREAIDERCRQLPASGRPDARAIVARLFDRYPDPPDLPPRGYDVHARREAREAVLGRRSPRR